MFFWFLFLQNDTTCFFWGGGLSVLIFGFGLVFCLDFWVVWFVCFGGVKFGLDFSGPLFRSAYFHFELVWLGSVVRFVCVRGSFLSKHKLSCCHMRQAFLLSSRPPSQRNGELKLLLLFLNKSPFNIFHGEHIGKPYLDMICPI